MLLFIPSTLRINWGFFYHNISSNMFNADSQQGELLLCAPVLWTVAPVEEVEFSPGFSSSRAACASAGEEELLWLTFLMCWLWRAQHYDPTPPQLSKPNVASPVHYLAIVKPRQSGYHQPVHKHCDRIVSWQRNISLYEVVSVKLSLKWLLLLYLQ